MIAILITTKFKSRNAIVVLRLLLFIEYSILDLM